MITISLSHTGIVTFIVTGLVNFLLLMYVVNMK